MGNTSSVVPTISAPPEFSPPNPLKCEGYWSKDYIPKVCTLDWLDKDKFIEMANIIEEDLKKKKSIKNYMGYAHSRLVPGHKVGIGTFVDPSCDISWPEGYVQHYIRDHNVMPTEKFYDYMLIKIMTI